MALTASYIAACMMAKLRVGWMVAGCAPAVRTITRSALFHCTTWFTGFVAGAIAGARFAAASKAAVVPAISRVFISVLRDIDLSMGSSRSTWPATDPVIKGDRRSMSAGSRRHADKTVTVSDLFEFSRTRVRYRQLPARGAAPRGIG